MVISDNSNIEHIHRDFMFLMGQINRQWRRILNRKLQPFGLTEPMWLPLIHIARSPTQMCQKDLAASLSLDSSAVVRLLDVLESSKFVERVEGIDRRSKTIQLTTLGKSTAQLIDEQISKNRNPVLACVSEDELKNAFHVLERMAETLFSIERKDL